MHYQMLIDGKMVDGADALAVIDPATGEAFATCARADLAILDRAVDSATRAFPIWSGLGHGERRAHLELLADAIQARSGEFAALLTQEQGKPRGQAMGEILASVAALRHFAGIDIPPRTLRDTEDTLIVEQRRALGAVATITPWNYPFLLLMLKVAPALSAGNTVVSKPAPTTPLTTALLGTVACETLPPGVFNTLIDDNDLGTALSQHPGIAKISFTGSTPTGRKVMRSASASLKRLTLELGGNDVAIVLDDVDVPAVARRIFAAATLNAGQVCMAAKRVFAHRSVYDDLCDELARLAREAIVGDGSAPDTQIGPIQNKAQFDKILAIIEDAAVQGTIVAGGGALPRPGYFIAPTIVRDIPDDARLVREEQFGPVVPVLVYDDIEDVVRRANDSEFGLGGTIWTGDPDRGVRLAMRIDTGTIWVNKHLDLPFDISFGGTKQSGLGRESGLDGLLEFTQVKIINAGRAAVA